jgi:hypothetical protein
MPEETSHKQESWVWRWTRRCIVLLVGCLLVMGASVWAVSSLLRSDLPRGIIVDELELQTGMRVKIDTARLSFTGGAIIEGLTITPPLDEAPLITVETVEAGTAWLPWIVLMRDPGLSQITITGLRVRVTEDAGGEWNALRAIELIAAAQQASGSANGGPSRMPAVTLSDASVTITRRDGTSIEAPLEFRAKPDGLSTLGFAASLAGNHAIGRLTPFGWDHRVELQAANLDAFAPLFPGVPITQPLFHGTWRGDMLQGDLSGVLRIDRASFEQSLAGGEIGVRLRRGGTVEATPRGLWVQDPRLNEVLHQLGGGQDPTALFNGGLVTIRADGLRVTQLGIAAEGFAADLWASWEGASRAATAEITWIAENRALALSHDGQLSLMATLPRIGSAALRAEVRAEGAMAGRHARLNAVADASGRNWSQLSGTLRFDELVINGTAEERFDLSGLRAALAWTNPTVSLSSLTLARAGTLGAQGSFDVDTGVWSLVVDGGGLDFGELGIRPLAGKPFDTRLVASGSQDRAEVLSWRASAMGVSGQGRAVYDRSAPQQLFVAGELDAPWASAAGLLGLEAPTDGASGQLAASFELAGNVEPLELEIETALRASGVHELGPDPLDISGRGEVSDTTARFETEPFNLWGGQWLLDARHEFAPSVTSATLNADGIDLAAAGALLAPDTALEGVGEFSAAITMTDLVFETARLDGEWTITDARGWLTPEQDRTPDWKIDRGSGEISLVGGRLRLHEMLLQRDATELHRGTLTGEIELDPLAGGGVRADLNLRQWLIESDDLPLVAIIDGRIGMDLDPAARGANGPFETKAALWWEGRRFADADITGVIEGRTIKADKITADVLNGTMTGAAVVPLDDWTLARGELTLVGIDLSQVGVHADEAQDLRGMLFGRVVAKDGSGDESFGPLRITAEFEVENGMHRGLAFNEVKLDAYAGSDRFMLDRSTAQIAGGEVTFWSRLSWHDTEPFVHIGLVGNGLTINELAKGFDPEFPDTPGVINLEAAMGGYVFPPRRAYGEAEVVIENSDLGNLPVISQLYGLLSVGPDRDEQGRPQGRGRARLRLEGDKLRLARLHYYNRGTDVLATGEIEDVWLGAQSPVVGTAAGALRPLGDSRIPFSAMLDRMFLAVSSKAVSVHVEGTAGNIQTRTVPLAEINRTIRRVLGSDGAEQR